jgi:hypothetical protein
MLRRIETYSVADVDDDGVRALETACARCDRFIPEVLYSHVGWNRSDAPVQLVWEHAFASPAAYHRYMVHPYHAAVLDRYLLHDSPERVVVDNDLAAGLVGYSCDEPAFAMTSGVRRLVLLDVDRHAAPADVDRLVATLGHTPVEVGAMTLSVVAANTLGSAWFDGVTPVAGPPRWSHLWEQGFPDDDALEAYLHGSPSLARRERSGGADPIDGIVRRTVSLHYDIGAWRRHWG